ncbi:MAG TPA: carboxypeptidase-like regulatory domain-containing protein, partial [Woeseiaceae bacterium]|nr:carboxypeptidase-like regulatory domain-containing protein [Woeseiaceae bacterium]
RVYGRVLDLNEIREASRNAVARGTVQGATVIAPVTDGSPTKIGRIGSGPTIELPEDAVSTRPPIGGDPILDVDSSGESDEWNDAGLQIADPVSQAVLTGRLTDAAGNGVPDSAVAVLRAANMQVITRTRTDANGEYTVAVFASEPVFLRFRNVYSFPNMSLVYFGGAVQPEGAQSLKIKPGQTVKADASLKVQECRISGVVSHESGLRLPGIRVGLYAWDAFDKPRPSPLHAVSTNSRGEFSIELTTLEEWSQVEDSFAVGCYGSACAEYTFMRLFAVDPTGSYESAMPPQRIYMTVSANVYSPGSDDQCNGSDNLFMMQ